jgi:uracil-DNA glycosylase
MQVRIEPSWNKVLKEEFEKAYFQSLANFVKQEYGQHKVYPPGKEIFAALDACPFHNTRVVILGQDPYHGPGQANGLCFSVREGIAFPPSLVNIFKEIEKDLGLPYPTSGDLSRWAKQGVLLLNATLTVRAGQAGSHQNKGWETFTDAVVEKLNEEQNGLVFMLWGGYAKRKGKRIVRKKHLVLESGHPSPLSANKGHWFGNKHFSQCNQYLSEANQKEIDWS